MRQVHARPKRLRGWVRWTPFLALPFSILFYEAWLQSQLLYHDYETLQLQRELASVNDRIAQCRDAEVSLTTLARLEETAPQLGLVEPEPNQIQEIDVAPTFRVMPRGPAIELARLEPDEGPVAATPGR